MQETFRTIYYNNLWESSETRSGIGSEVAHTKEIRVQLSQLLKDFNIKTFLDAPCGDFNWMQKVDLTGIQYIGADILSEIVEDNRLKYSRDSLNFIELDITQDPLPDACLIFIRDCLVHFSYHDIASFISNLHRSNITYLVTTTFTDRSRNYDITTGDWRPLNLGLAPFLFPHPLRMMNEKFKAYEGTFPDKSLALYRVVELPTSLTSIPHPPHKEPSSSSKIGRHY